MTDDPTSQPEDPDIPLAAEYVLGLLDEDAARAFEERMQRDGEARADYAFWCENLAHMTDTIPSEAPPAHVLRAINERLFPEETRVGGASWLWGLLIGGVLTTALVLFAVFGLQQGGPGNTRPELVATVAAEDQSLFIAAAFDAESNALQLDRQAGAALPGRALELWLILPEQAPLSLGVLADGAQSTVQLDPSLIDQLTGAVLAVSDEPPGGSPEAGPTGAVLAVGELAALDI